VSACRVSKRHSAADRRSERPGGCAARIVLYNHRSADRFPQSSHPIPHSTIASAHLTPTNATILRPLNHHITAIAIRRNHSGSQSSKSIKSIGLLRLVWIVSIALLCMCACGRLRPSRSCVACVSIVYLVVCDSAALSIFIDHPFIHYHPVLPPSICRS